LVYLIFRLLQKTRLWSLRDIVLCWWVPCLLSSSYSLKTFLSFPLMD